MFGYSYYDDITKLVTWASVSDFKDRFPDKSELLIWKKKYLDSLSILELEKKYPQDYQFYEDFIENENSLNISNALKEFDGKLLVCYATLDKVITKKTCFKHDKLG